MAGVTKVTIIDSPEKMRLQSTGYSIIIPRAREEPSVNKGTEAEETSTTK